MYRLVNESTGLLVVLDYIADSSPRKAKSLLFSLYIHSLVKLLKVLRDVRDILGHLSTSVVLSDAGWPGSVGSGIEASSETFSHGLVEGNDISLSLCRCVDDMLGILVEMFCLLSGKFCVHLFKLMLSSPQLPAPGAFLSLCLKDEQ